MQPTNQFEIHFHDLPNSGSGRGIQDGRQSQSERIQDGVLLADEEEEVWLASNRDAKFPELWPQCPACARLERFLGSNAGRAKILTCIKAGVGLGGDPKCPDVRGIEECHIVIEELLRIKAEKLKNKGNETAAPSSDAAEPGVDMGGSVPCASTDDGADGLSFFEAEPQDPVEQKVHELSLKEMLHINFFIDIEKALDEVEGTVSREFAEMPHPIGVEINSETHTQTLM